jgi:thiol-disulfide isomerase/thioredoxin
MSSIPELRDASQFGDLAIVMFTAHWCKPCKALKPLYEKLAQDYRGVVEFWYVHEEQESAKPLLQMFNIPGFPTFYILARNSASTVEELHLDPLNAEQSFRNALDNKISESKSHASDIW